MTSVLKVMTEYCAIYVDDIRLQDLATENPPQYAREMWNYFRAAIPLFSVPAEMETYLYGTPNNPKLTEPLYDNATYTVSGDQTADFTVSLGAEYANYGVVSCRVKNFDLSGNVYYTDVPYTYDAENGDFTVSASADSPVPGGTILDFDFFTDGQFENDLTPAMMSILGMCFQVVWQDRFNEDWLSNVSKVEDKSFSEQNRANKLRADTQRLESLRIKLAEEMRRFSQNRYYNKTVRNKLNF